MCRGLVEPRGRLTSHPIMGDDLLKAVLEFIRQAEGAGFENEAGPLEHLTGYREMRALTDLESLPELPHEAE
jgi:hypothetical protein